MRKILVSLAAAGAALAFASPASAQYYPGQPYGYGYGQQYGYGFNNYGQVRSLQYRIDRVQRMIERLDDRGGIGERQARGLRYEARSLERRLHYSARFGLNPYEVNDISRRVSILEQRVQFASSYGWNRYGQRYGWNGYNNGYYGYGDRDRDHDGDHDGDRDDWRDRDND